MREDPSRVVIVDDHALFRGGLALLLERDRRVSVVAEGNSGKQAVLLAQEHAPDVMLLDVELGDGTSADSIIRQIGRLAPTVQVIVLTMYRDTVLKDRLIRAGAVEYVTKNVPGPDLVDIVVRTHRRGRVEGPIAASRELPGNLLSDRELQVLHLIGQAQSNRDISARLSIAEGTVKRHTTNIYAKLGASSRIDAVRKAGRLGLF